MKDIDTLKQIYWWSSTGCHFIQMRVKKSGKLKHIKIHCILIFIWIWRMRKLTATGSSCLKFNIYMFCKYTWTLLIGTPSINFHFLIIMLIPPKIIVILLCWTNVYFCHEVGLLNVLWLYYHDIIWAILYCVVRCTGWIFIHHLGSLGICVSMCGNHHQQNVHLQ